MQVIDFVPTFNNPDESGMVAALSVFTRAVNVNLHSMFCFHIGNIVVII